MVENLYHEKQKWQQCLIHTVNNILQRNEYDKEQFDEFCYAMNESRWMNPHKSWIGLGNYDANILMSALEMQDLKMQWIDKRKNANDVNMTKVKAFVVNIPTSRIIPFMSSRHWYAVLQFEDSRWANLDSKINHPIEIENIAQFIDEKLKRKDVEVMAIVQKDTTSEDLLNTVQ